MCCNDPGGRPINRFGRGWPPHLGPHPSHRMRRLASLAAASAPIATAAVASVANASQATASSPPSPSRSPSPLASATAVPPNALMELLGPHLSQLTVQWLTAAGSHAQRLLEGHLAELYQEGCPATSALLRAHMYGAAVQDRAAILQGQVWRLLSWTLVHAGPIHLATNHIALAKLGPQLERVAGQKRFTAIYVGSAAAATVFSLALNGGRSSLGSSGALFGLAAALWRYQAAHSGLLPAEAAESLQVSGKRAMQVAVGYHLLLWSRLDIWAHVGGALGGGALAALLGPDFKLVKARGPGPAGWPINLVQLPFGIGARGGSGAAAGGMLFRDRPMWSMFADPEPRTSIPFPQLGPAYSVTAAAAAAALGRGRRH
ncbi:hypothetical protein Vafri_3668 [Volvox africanus]|uniref:Peptidase S54 rhomboid domain-containing protein n=1 Tax=Volvox africanus TaxID=51714 RepID=A0A8J4AWP7_9CHLO|nr:hypothetical protein Vafri_3668 [Volvox africanus]